MFVVPCWFLLFLWFDRAAGFLPPRPREGEAGARRSCQGWPALAAAVRLGLDGIEHDGTLLKVGAVFKRVGRLLLTSSLPRGRARDGARSRRCARACWRARRRRRERHWIPQTFKGSLHRFGCGPLVVMHDNKVVEAHDAPSQMDHCQVCEWNRAKYSAGCPPTLNVPRRCGAASQPGMDLGEPFPVHDCRRAQGERALASEDNRQCPLKPPGSQLPIPHAGDAKYD
jgi:hypothetical protein